MPSVPDHLIVSKPVAIIDIGSNSIKLLVATGPGLCVVEEATEETRISTGIGSGELRLADEAIEAGLHSVRRLWERAMLHRPEECIITATSAVRDAVNRSDFVDPVRELTGIEVRTLSGVDEARFIGLGVAQDPHINSAEPFYLLDLGGGSLELLEFSEGQVRQKVSLQLGAVRLMEKLLDDPQAPMPEGRIEAIQEYVTEAVAVSDFSFRAGSGLVGTGGAMTFARFLLGAEKDLRPEKSPPILDFNEMCALRKKLCGMSLEKRLLIKNLPAARADIMPIALVILTTIMELAGASSAVHSFYNLRYGLAADALTRLKAASLDPVGL